MLNLLRISINVIDDLFDVVHRRERLTVMATWTHNLRVEGETCLPSKQLSLICLVTNNIPYDTKYPKCR